MKTWTLDELKKHRLSYNVCRTVVQIVDDIEGIYGIINSDTREFSKILLHCDMRPLDINILSIYLFDGITFEDTLCELTKYDPKHAPEDIINVSCVIYEASITQCSYIDDMRACINLHEDVPIKLCYLNNLIQHELHYKDSHLSRHIDLDTDFIMCLNDFASLYLGSGKRVAFDRYREVLSYRYILDKLSEAYELDLCLGVF